MNNTLEGTTQQQAVLEAAGVVKIETLQALTKPRAAGRLNSNAPSIPVTLPPSDVKLAKAIALKLVLAVSKIWETPKLSALVRLA